MITDQERIAQLAEAQQARNNDRLKWAGDIADKIRECDTLRGLLRETLGLIETAHHWNNLEYALNVRERITAALKEGK